MKTFTAGKDLIMVDGDIYIEDIHYCKWDETLIKLNPESGRHYKIIASTKQLEGIKLLDRSLFVKHNPITKVYEELPDIVKKHLNYVSFEIGYNANKNEFTEQDIQSAIIIAYNAGKEGQSESKSSEFIFKLLRPLALPKSITTNDELDIISVNWEQ
jgi:hypothetical protein